MEDKSNLDSFAALVKAKILAGDPPVEIRKYVRRELNVGKSRGNEFFASVEKSLTKKERAAIPRVDVEVKDVAAEGFVDLGNIAVAEMKGVQTLAELIAAAEVDLEVWEVVKSAVSVYRGNFSVRAEFRKRVEEKQLEDILKQFIDQAEKHSPKKWPAWKSNDGEYMYLLGIQDLHLSKLCWGEESGQDYDLKIAKKYYEDAIDDLMSKVSGKKIEKVVLIVGSDFFQTDTPNSTTTKGTFVDSDSRWTKVFSEGADLMVKVVEKLSSHYNVSLVQCGGNHDMATSYYLGLYLKAWFRNNDKVTVNCSPSVRKYESFGNTLVGIMHGDGMKLADLPLTMMRENQATISNYKWIEGICGHWHQEKQIEVKGIKMRVSPALCPPDAWHDKNNFSFNVQTSQGLLYSKNDGIEAIYYSKPVN